MDIGNDTTSKAIMPDIYFTIKNNEIHVFARSWKAATVNLQTMTPEKYKVKTVTLLGSDKRIKWKQNVRGLLIKMPSRLVQAAPVYVFKITL